MLTFLAGGLWARHLTLGSVPSAAGWASWYLPHGAAVSHPVENGVGHMRRAQQRGAEVTFPPPHASCPEHTAWNKLAFSKCFMDET